MSDDPRRHLPSVDRVVRGLAEADPALPEWVRLEAARWAIARARTRISQGNPAGDVTGSALATARELSAPSPRGVVNATGVVLHTNLGRSVLSSEAADHAGQRSAGYSDLEFDLATGQRGSRLDRVETLLKVLSGAPAGLAVNNNAAALLLALAGLARGREVIVSRGELVEIGGSFRVPDIMEQAGVRLVEVGTTNRTHARDYEDAIGADTGVLLKVHRSNFSQSGFVTEVGLPELVEIGRAHGIPVVDDLGSGSLLDLRPNGLPEDTFVPARLASGVDVLCFSGDKLLGGPQAGLLLGSADAIGRLRKHPLARALRMDKLSLAALDRTLRHLADGDADAIPTVRQLREPADAVHARAKRLEERLRKVLPGGFSVSLVETRAPVGGGSVPGFTLASFAVALEGAGSADRVAAALRAAPTPVIARVESGRVLLDAKTLLEGDDARIEEAVRALSLD